MACRFFRGCPQTTRRSRHNKLEFSVGARRFCRYLVKMKTRYTHFAAISLVVILAVTACHSADDNSARPVAHKEFTDKVQWNSWDQTSFSKAANESKLIFLYLSTPWCAPCAEAERELFGNDTIAEILNSQYIPIEVDGDRYPNVAERYSLGGYPSCVILTPDLRLLGGTVRVPADSLQLLLERVNDTWQHTPVLAEMQASRLDSLFRQSVHARKLQRPSDELIRYTERVVAHYYDSTYGGFGNQPKFPLPEVNDFAFTATAPEGGPLFKDEITHTLKAQLNLLDPVWGGFYRSAAFADWSNPSHEKLLADNAMLLINYVDAFLYSKDSTYMGVAEQAVSYIDKFLRTDRGWGFYNSQAGVVLHDNELTDPREYFGKDDANRRKIGLPAIQQEVYTAANCYAVSAYLKAGRVLKRQELIEYATKTLDSLLAVGVGAKGLMRHSILSPEANDPMILADQVAMVTALLDVYETTGNKQYLAGGIRLSEATYSQFNDPATGGLTTDIAGSDVIGRMSVPMKPFSTNAAASTNFVRLFYYTADVKYRQPAEAIFLYLMNIPIRNDDLRLCSLTRTYLRITRFPTKLAMLGPRNEEYNALLGAIFSRNFPRLTLTHLGDGKTETQYGELKFAPTDRAQLFVCGDDTLSHPITEADSVDVVVRAFQFSLMNKR